jgi:hypothetical protein
MLVNNITDSTFLNWIIDAHGGLALWKTIDKINLKIRIGGLLLATRFKSPTIRTYEVSIDTSRIRTVLQPFPLPDMVGVFEGDTVKIESIDGKVIDQREMHRLKNGTISKPIWDDLDLLYFFGYALWNYATTPFVFLWPGFKYHEGEPWKEAAAQDPWKTLHVTFPPGFPTHSTKQIFYFDSQGKLQRVDYTAQMFGQFARAAHYCDQHKSFDGLLMPTHRKVFVRTRSGRIIRFTGVMEGWVDDVKIQLKPI